ncbi:NAD(P)/FAD-dependent oxidoreductase [Candidatus Omnitrophota bacterium]
MYELIIVGGGIAGSTAAIYAARKKMEYLFMTDTLGGQFLESGEILNYPGVVKTTGADFSGVFEEQLKFNNVELKVEEKVSKIEKMEGGFRVSSDKGSYEAKAVIIATGSYPKKLNVPGEKEFFNKGVTYCSICDGPLFSGKTIAIIGGGNSALEGVDFVKNVANKIYLINIEKEFSAHEYLIEKVASYKNIEVINKARTTAILGDKFVNAITYEKDGQTQKLDVQGVIIEAGRTPNTGFAEGFVDLDEHKHIVIDCQTNTSVEGIFAAGDCSSVHEYQYTIAAGQGCVALLKAARYLANKK